MIHLKRLLMTSLVGIPLLAGCTSTQPEPEPVVQQPDPVNQEVLKALSDLSEIKQELKKLRNSVEELQFESENAKRRQQDLYQDLDRRLVGIERNQTALTGGTLVTGDNQTETGQSGVEVVGLTSRTCAVLVGPSGRGPRSNHSSKEMVKRFSGIVV